MKKLALFALVVMAGCNSAAKQEVIHNQKLHQLQEIRDRLHLKNLETELDTLELERDLAKLQGKPFNTKKLTLKRAEIAQFKTGVEIANDLEEITK